MPSKPIDRVRKPRQQRALATVDAILQATAQIIRRDGLAGLTTNTVARVAGVSIGTLYQYFTDKEALYDALFERADAIFAERLGAVLPTLHTGPIDDAIDAFLEATFSVRREDPTLVREVLRLFRRGADSRVEQIPSSITRAVHALLEIRKEELGIHNVERAAFVLLTATHAVLINRIVDEQFQIDDIEDEVRRLVFGYLRLPTPPRPD